MGGNPLVGLNELLLEGFKALQDPPKLWQHSVGIAYNQL